jgi:chorismate mutase/prephenate dehydratase
VLAVRHGLDILAADVHHPPAYQTRFYAAAAGDAAGEAGTPPPPAAGRSGRKKTALLLETPNQPGSLVRVLEPFARRRINLSKLESRPGPVPWTYRFILEVECEDPDAEDEALHDVNEAAASLRVLGRFPADTPAGG